VRHDRSFAEKQESPPALLVVVPCDILRGVPRDARMRPQEQERWSGNEMVAERTALGGEAGTALELVIG
jgi:hypothetical protein